jgi:hypothetical protein
VPIGAYAREARISTDPRALGAGVNTNCLVARLCQASPGHVKSDPRSGGPLATRHPA